jgi:hypothetical protein
VLDFSHLRVGIVKSRTHYLFLLFLFVYKELLFWLCCRSRGVLSHFYYCLIEVKAADLLRALRDPTSLLLDRFGDAKAFLLIIERLNAFHVH